MALAIVCIMVLTIGNHNDGIIASAFSPSYHRVLSPVTRVQDVAISSSSSSSTSSTSKININKNKIASPATTFARRTSLAYKYKHDHESHAKNETALDDSGRTVQVDMEVTVEISKNDVIYYNDLDDDEPVMSDSSSSNYDASQTADASISSDIDDVDDNNIEGEDLIQELENTIQERTNIKIIEDDETATISPPSSPEATPPEQKVIEPSKTKPAKKFISPIRMIKKVPKVEPIQMSVFFLKFIGDTMSDNRSSNKQGPTSPSTNIKSDETNKPTIENWKTQMEKRKKGPTAFMATNYLEALSVNNANTKNDNGSNKDDKDDMLKALRDQQAQLRNEQQRAQQNAIYEANRRTSPKDVVAKRIEEGHNRRKKKERDRLEMLYVERKERLDAKKRDEERYLEEKGREKEVLEEKARERNEAAAAAKEEGGGGAANGAEVGEDTKKLARLQLTSRNGKRGIPILDRPYVDAPPLLIGSTLAIPYSELTPFQKRAIDVARGYHQEHCERMEIQDESESHHPLSWAGEECSIQAAPIIAVIDGYTAAATKSLLAPATPSSQQPKVLKRYATLASIEFVESANNENGGEPSAIKLVGVGRAFLHDYFSSKDIGMPQEEEELSKLLAMIQEYDRQEFYEDEDEDEEHIVELDDDDEEDDEELPVVMAEFDLLLDDSSLTPSDEVQSTKYGEDVTKHRASSMHAITELYRCANKVYRLHEERKKLVTGLRAGEARLRLGKEDGAASSSSAEGAASAEGSDDNCWVEFEDCDGLGSLLVGVLDDQAANELGQQQQDGVVPASESDAPRSRLETLENYGLGSYGILSTIPDLTKQLLVHLEPYYSPTHREREEYEAEIASFVAFKSLEAYVAPNEVAEALVVPNSATQRLERAYEIMMRHRDELMELVEKISQELMECGEECTDLW